MRVAIAVDHAGYPLKSVVKDQIELKGHEPVDLGAHQFDAEDDYPDYARYLGQAIHSGQAPRGILLCGSGVGASVAANKIGSVRAAVCHDTYSARQGVEHDDMNVLCLGTRIIGSELARELVSAFLGAHYSNQSRHARRLEKIQAIEDAWRAKPGGGKSK